MILLMLWKYFKALKSVIYIIYDSQHHAMSPLKRFKYRYSKKLEVKAKNTESGSKFWTKWSFLSVINIKYEDLRRYFLISDQKVTFGLDGVLVGNIKFSVRNSILLQVGARCWSHIVMLCLGLCVHWFYIELRIKMM